MIRDAGQLQATVSENVHAHGLRNCRYRGIAKTHGQHVVTGAGTNISRLSDCFPGQRCTVTAGPTRQPIPTPLPKTDVQHPARSVKITNSIRLPEPRLTRRGQSAWA
ncbi:transposase [Streptomyces sp. NPDC126522]|uniref:transposase n=1 Tax=Streptomyces sp. NPDC126522 TaxID=3155211 RepID=UPI00332A34F8